MSNGKFEAIRKLFLAAVTAVMPVFAEKSEAAGQPSPASKVVEVTTDNYEQEVTNSKLPVVIDFYATWCGPCRRLAPVLDKAADEYAGKVKFVRIDVDKSPGLAKAYAVCRYPTVVLLKELKGKKVYYTSVGFKELPTLKEFIDSSLKAG